MIITRLILNDYGLYKGKNEIVFPIPGYDKNITVIGGLNGRGKTTILEAVTIALYGKRSINVLRNGRMTYNQFISEHFNKKAQSKQSSLELSFYPEQGISKEITIKRSWIRSGNEIKEEFVALYGDDEQSNLTENWDYFVEDMLPLSISRFFFFDNERISEIAEDESFESIKGSIKALFGITSIEQLITDIRNNEKKRRQKNEGNQVEGIEDRITETREEIEKTEKEIQNLYKTAAENRTLAKLARKDYAKLESEFWEQGGNLGLKKDEYISQQSIISKSLSEKKEQVLDLVIDAETPLLLCPKVLNKSYNSVKDIVRYEKSLLSGDILSQIRAKATEMELDNAAKMQLESILTEIEKSYQLDKNDSTFSSMSSISLALFDSFIVNKESTLSNIRKLLSDIYTMKNELTQLEINLSFEINETKVRDLWAQMQELTRNIITYDANVAAAEASQSVLEVKLESIRKKYSRLLDSSYAKEQNEDEAIRITRYSNMSIEVLQEYLRRLQSSRVEKLQRYIKECFSLIAQKNDLIESVYIDPVTLDIQLADYSGAVLTKDQLSAGEKQIFAVSLLWGLAKCSGYQMPVIIDTPLGRLDSIHRTSFVQQYLPNASKQVIILSTDEELNDRYLSLAKDHINEKYIIIYNEDEKSSAIEKGYFGE